MRYAGAVRHAQRKAILSHDWMRSNEAAAQACGGRTSAALRAVMALADDARSKVRLKREAA